MEPVIDTSKPHSARVYDYYLGGKDNFAADRETAEQAMQSWRAVRTAVRENRAFLGRAVRYLVAEAGIRQFLDIGTGLPSANNVHEVAQAAAPEILASSAVTQTLDLSQPVALILVAILHFLVDADDPAAIVGKLLGALPAGSYPGCLPRHAGARPGRGGRPGARLPAGRHPRPGPDS
jgi:S-adenosyl methyltransferase